MVPWRPHPGPAASKKTKMLESGHDSLGVRWDEEGWRVGWGEVGWSWVGRSVTWYPMFSPMQLKKRDTYAPKATPSNPRKQMNETLTRWGCAFSRARCRRGAHRFSGSRGSRGGKKWSGCGRPARFACRAKTRITENKGINKQRRPHINDEVWQQDACVRLPHWPNVE